MRWPLSNSCPPIILLIQTFYIINFAFSLLVFFLHYNHHKFAFHSIASDSIWGMHSFSPTVHANHVLYSDDG